MAKSMAREYLYKKQVSKHLSPTKTLTLIFILCASFSSDVCAIETYIPIIPKPVGSGARALGQSAFIAVADDATAASWNPAGLINLERPEVSFVGALRSVEGDYSMTDPLESSNPESWSDSEINFMSYAQPLQVGNTDVVLSINYHQVYDFGVEFNSYKSSPILNYFGVPIGQEETQYKGKSKGAISAYTLAGGLSIPDYPQITIGVGINWYTQSLFNGYAWQIKKTRTDTKDWDALPTEQSQLTDDETFDDFRAQNLTFGFLWDVYERQENLLTLGLVYHTTFTAKVDWELVRYVDSKPDPLRVKSMDIDFPSSLGAGVNYRFSDSLSAAFDVELKEWSKYSQTFVNDRPTMPFDDDTVSYRLGFEHLSLPKGAEQSVYALRGGVFYEPRPTWNDILPVYGFSTGLGWTLMEEFSLDFAYQYRWGEQELKDFDYKIKEQFFVASVITYF